MKALRMIGLGAALALVSSAALAFQEQQSGGGAPAQVPAAQAHVQSGVGKAQVAPDSVGAAPSVGSAGTEVRIPGLGKLGVLPKMDFGLELLYGAAERKPTETPSQTGEDLQIRGSLKHRF